MILKDYFNRLVHASPVAYYVSGIDGARTTWPWRMNKAGAKEFRRAYVETCRHHILDSNFKDDSVTNQDVLDRAHQVESDGAVLADVYHDPDATAEALVDGLALARDHAFSGTIVLPLQQPYREVYDRVAPHTDDLTVWWALGGIKDDPAAEKVAATKQFRSYVGAAAHIHGLGFGVTDRLARAVRRDGDLLDSIDNSTAIANVASGVSGTEATTVVAARALAERIERLRKLTHYAADEAGPQQLRKPGQAGLPVRANP